MPPVDRRPRSRRLAGDVTLGVAAAAIACWVAPPFRLGAVGSDSTSTVVYFQRIVAGERLERFLGTAPKPLLTAIYGPLYAATHDWRLISGLAIVVYGVAIVATTTLIARIAGRAAGAAGYVGLLASAGLLQDVALAYTISWAVLSWSVAGLAATEPTPRYGVAGIALLMGGLARQETWFITALATLVVAGCWMRSRRSGHPSPPPAAWRVAFGFGAIPILALHDWLLTGDLAYSYHTPRLGSDIRPPQDPGTAGVILRMLVERSWPLMLAGAIGAFLVIRSRRWPLLVALVALGPGVAAFLLYQGRQGIFVLHRYALPVELAIIVVGAVGIGATIEWAGTRRGVDRSPWWPAATVVLGAATAVVLAPTSGPFDDAARAAIAADRRLVEDFTIAAPSIASTLAAWPSSLEFSRERDARDVVRPSGPALLVPARVFPMATAQFELPLNEIDRLDAAALEADGADPGPGPLALLTDGSTDAITEPPGAYPVVFSDPGRAIWVVWLDAP